MSKDFYKFRESTLCEWCFCRNTSSMDDSTYCNIGHEIDYHWDRDKNSRMCSYDCKLEYVKDEGEKFYQEKCETINLSPDCWKDIDKLNKERRGK